MGVAAQFYDFIFAYPLKNSDEDAALIDAVSLARNAYFGVSFAPLRKDEAPDDPAVQEYLKATAWRIAVDGGPDKAVVHLKSQMTGGYAIK